MSDLRNATHRYERSDYQVRIEAFMLACFGRAISDDVRERNHRFIEEALELVQATGCTAPEAHMLVDYVFGRPTGEAHKEAGAVMLTLGALCNTIGLSMEQAGEDELARVWEKIDAIRAKQKSKPRNSPLPQVTRSANVSNGEVRAPTIAGNLSEIEPDGNERRSGEADREGRRGQGSARRDELRAGGAERGSREAGSEGDRESGLTQERGRNAPAPLRISLDRALHPEHYPPLKETQSASASATAATSPARITQEMLNAGMDKYREVAASMALMAGQKVSAIYDAMASLTPSATAFTREDAAKLIERKANALRDEYCHGDTGPGGYTWSNKEAEWQVILLDELAEEVRNG